jgi:Amt family ammonium transporter
MSHLKRYLPMVCPLLLAPFPALAAVDTGDTSWMMIATALVLLMTPGLAFFYAGMVRRKNAVTTLYQNIVSLGVIGLLWVVVGFSLAFSGGSGFIGDTTKMLLAGVGQEPDGASTIPYLLFMAYQMMFAIITPALMTGAFAERVRFVPWIVVLVLWSLCVYSPVAHWVWASTGWLFAEGALDFAGGLVVHMTAGFSALMAAILIGRRKDFGQAHKPYDVGMIVLGTSLLWFGWFGFNAGSALASGGLAVQAFVNTFISAAAAMLVWTLVDTIKDGKPTLMGGCIGIVAGLVAITPAAGFVTTTSAILIGVLAGSVCNIVARIIKGTFKIDDTLDVFACHGIGGLLGVIMTGLLATTTVNAAGADGLLNGGETLFMANLTGAAAVAGYSMAVTFVIIKLVNLVFPLRASALEEDAGLDGSQHGESINSAI